jgi:tetratricopeptide (TPR) repeat protein
MALFNLSQAGGTAWAIQAGQTAPGFTLSDIYGRSYTLTEIKGRQMTVLYFFDAVSDASQGGLLVLDRLLRKYEDKQLTIWGITRSSKEEVQRFNQKAQLRFPILLDKTQVSVQYDAHTILPVVCTLGPGLEILDHFQGGGETIETMLVRLAERQIHRGQAQLAQAMAASAANTNPANVQAKAMQGYAALAQGQTAVAKQTFDQIAAAGGYKAVIGQEGQAAVLARLGQGEQALAMADAITKHSPERVVAHKIKGDILAAKGDRKAAAAAYQSAAAGSEAPAFQKAEAYNQMGRMYAQAGDYSQARKLFDQSIALDPYYIEPTSNKGVAYEKEGLWTKALAEYRQAQALDPADTIAAVLTRKAEQMLALQADTAAKTRMDQLVKDLVERYKSQKAQPLAQVEDQWTSRPMVLSFVDIQEQGGLSSRDGLAMVLASRLGELLNASGRLQVVERAVMEQLLTELNLGSSELADPQTALTLGKLLSAKLIATGTMLYLPDSTVLNLRLIDTETSAIAKTITHRLEATADLERELFDLNRSILKTVLEKYPLQGYIVRVEGKEAMINLGRNQGVTTGTAFEAVVPGKEEVYRGKVLRGASQTVAKLEVVRVEPDLCYARITQAQRPIARDDQVKEVVPAAVLKGAKDGQ